MVQRNKSMAEAARIMAAANEAARKQFEREKHKQMINEVSKLSGFTKSQIQSLYSHFKNIDNFLKNRSLLQEEEEMEKAKYYCEDVVKVDKSLIELSPQKLMKAANNMDFRNYVEALSFLLKKGTYLDKFQLLFQIFDSDGDGKLSQTQLFELLCSHAKGMNPGKIKFPKKATPEEGEERRKQALYTWVKKHFRAATSNEKNFVGEKVLDYKECVAIIQTHPTLFDQNNINIDVIIQSFAKPLDEIKSLESQV